MSNVEKKILAWIDDHLMLIVVLAISLIGFAVRAPLMDFASGDFTFFLQPWYAQIQQNGLTMQVGNYNFVYQLLIFLMTKLPMESLHAYKLLSVVFDYLLAVAAAVVLRTVREDKLWKCIFAYGAVLLSPAVFLNSAAWAQCDAIFVFFAVGALSALLRDRYRLAMILMGLSFSFKLQAIFFLPLLLFVYFRKRKFSVLEFLWIPAVMCLTSLPAAFFGRSIFEVFAVYGGQTETYPYMAMNYPSAWLLLALPSNAQQYELLRSPAILVTLSVLAILMLTWIRTKAAVQGKNLLYMAFLLSFTCVLFLPSMHERYGYLYEVLAIVIACVCPATIPLCVGLVGISLCTYGAYLFKIETISLIWLTVINLAVYVAYAVLLCRKMTVEETE